MVGHPLQGFKSWQIIAGIITSSVLKKNRRSKTQTNFVKISRKICLNILKVDEDGGEPYFSRLKTSERREVGTLKWSSDNQYSILQEVSVPGFSQEDGLYSWTKTPFPELPQFQEHPSISREEPELDKTGNCQTYPKIKIFFFSKKQIYDQTRFEGGE